ncbi:hypothetical protein A9W93_09030 [Mycobacterium colombiense]|nr:hypothetical protein A9W93_09030 [Mycobacterium colombiense]
MRADAEGQRERQRHDAADEDGGDGGDRQDRLAAAPPPQPSPHSGDHQHWDDWLHRHLGTQIPQIPQIPSP